MKNQEKGRNLVYCHIYKSPRRLLTYLYVAQTDDFSSVPETLLTHFGQPCFVMRLALNHAKPLANADINQIRHAILTQGYYLQLPPSE